MNQMGAFEVKNTLGSVLDQVERANYPLLAGRSSWRRTFFVLGRAVS